MKNTQLQKRHIQSFADLSLSDRLSWSFSQNQFFSGFMDNEAKQISKNIRKNGKKYFKA